MPDIDFINDRIVDVPVVNVASVPQRSPFRYPGGKTWLIPTVRKWLASSHAKQLIEPFAGGGIVSLTAAAENFVEMAVMIEMDESVAAVWETILSDKNEWLRKQIIDFNLTPEAANLALSEPGSETEQVAFRTLLRNRISHGGILAKGSGFIKTGENGKGLLSRWYPKTLYGRIKNISNYSHKLKFIKGDAFQWIPEFGSDKQNAFFIDPPYTVAGKRLYTHFDLDHAKLFKAVSQIKGAYLITYDYHSSILKLAKYHNLDYRLVPMKTTHHITKYEMLISDNFDWLNVQDSLY